MSSSVWWRGRCNAEGQIYSVVYASREFRSSYDAKITRQGEVLLTTALALHRIDCAATALAWFSLPATWQRMPGPDLAQVWARQIDAQRQEVLTWCAMRLDCSREAAHLQLENLGFPHWWGQHNDPPGSSVVPAMATSPGVGSGAPAAGSSRSTENDDNAKDE